MKTNPYLSFKKRKLLRRLAMILVLLFIFDVGLGLIDRHNKLVEEQNQPHKISKKGGIEFKYSDISPIPRVSFFTLYLLILGSVLIFAKKYFVPLLMTLCAVSLFVYEINSTYNFLASIEPQNQIQFFFSLASPINWLQFIIVLSLLFWLIFNLFRILILRNDKTSGTRP
jgi:hypothetical protein